MRYLKQLTGDKAEVLEAFYKELIESETEIAQLYEVCVPIFARSSLATGRWRIQWETLR